MAVNFSNRSSRFIPKRANNGLSKAMGLIRILLSIMIPGRNLKAKMNSLIALSRRFRTSSRQNDSTYHRPHPGQIEILPDKTSAVSDLAASRRRWGSDWDGHRAVTTSISACATRTRPLQIRGAKSKREDFNIHKGKD